MPWRVPLFFWAVVTVFAATATAEDISHVIRPGDTPVALAHLYHVTVGDIMSRNRGLDACHLKVGTVLYVPQTPPQDTGASPAASVLPDDVPAGPWYVVAPGDCPAGIASRFGISLESLSKSNPGMDPKNLPVGKVLSIPSAMAAAPPPVTVTRPDAPGASAPMVMDFQ